MLQWKSRASVWVLFLHPKRRAVLLESPPRLHNCNTIAPALHIDYCASEQMMGLSVLRLEGLQRVVGARSRWKNWRFSSLLRDACQSTWFWRPRNWLWLLEPVALELNPESKPKASMERRTKLCSRICQKNNISTSLSFALQAHVGEN